MTGSADANLLVAYALADDALHGRARAHMRKVGRLRASVPAVLEGFIAVRRRGAQQQAFVAALHAAFDLEDPEAMETAARALDEGLLKTPFDAYHAADAFLRGEPLHTADQDLLKSAFPTVGF